MPRTGRPTKCTPELTAKFCEALRSGCSRKDAAQYAGVDPTTATTWLTRGKNVRAKKCYREFRKRVMLTEASVKIRALGLIQKAADGDWKAAAWWLARKDPKNWADQTRLKIKQELQAKVEAEVKDDRLEQLLKDPTLEHVLQQLVHEAPLPGALHKRDGNGGNGA